MTGKDAAFCKKCRFHSQCAREIICDYIGITNVPRGCPAGVKCTKRQPIEKKRTIKTP